MNEIVGIGANVMDTLFRLDAFPTEDTKKKATCVTQSGGGPCGTGLVAAAKLGAKCAYLGNGSSDRAGEFLREDFKKWGVSTEYMRQIPDTTAFVSCIWLSDETASRTCVFHRGNVPGTEISADMADAIRSAQILMVDGNDMLAAVEGAKIAKSAGTFVLYDAGGLYEGVEKLLEQTDILIPSQEFALGHTGEETVADAVKKLYNTYRPKVIVITQGKAGGILYDGAEVVHYPAFPVEAVDTNGSGDVFHGAFAFALTKGFSYKQACVFSSAVSALKCTKVGARQGVPTFGQTLRFLKSRGVDIEEI